MNDDRLMVDSNIYTDKSEVYEMFSQAEDSLKKIVSFMLPKVQDKVVLDFGCGTGKFIPELSVISRKYIATDINESQLAVARKKSANLLNVEIIKTEKDKLPLDDKSVDIIFSSWVIGSIHDLDLRSKVIKELKRVLKPDGAIYLIENDVDGEHKNIVEGDAGNQRTEKKLTWFKENNFQIIEHVKTSFSFKSIEIAKHIYESIWNKEIADKISKKEISLNLVFLEYR